MLPRPRVLAGVLALLAAGCVAEPDDTEPAGPAPAHPLPDAMPLADDGIDGGAVDLPDADPDPEPPACDDEPTPALAVPDPLCGHLHPIELPPPPPNCLPGDPDALGAIEVERDDAPALPGDAVTVAFHPTGPRAPSRWWVSGEMPPGLQFDPCTARITGTLGWPEGRVVVTAIFDDPADPGRCEALTTAVDFGDLTPCAIHIEPTETTLPDATQDERYGIELGYWRAEGGPSGAEHTRFRFEGGDFPIGAALDCELGVLDGALMEPGEYTFDVRWLELECGGVSQTDTYHLTVRPRPE